MPLVFPDSIGNAVGEEAIGAATRGGGDELKDDVTVFIDGALLDPRAGKSSFCKENSIGTGGAFFIAAV